MTYLLVFLGMLVSDYLWGRYILATSRDHAALAGTLSSCIVGIGAVVTIAYVDNPFLLVPAMAGAFIGTIVAIRRG